MKLYCAAFSIGCICLISCESPSETHVSDDKVFVKSYSQLSEYENQTLSVSGFLSYTHEATGLYFTLEDLDDENDKCIILRPLPDLEHAVRVELSGKLIASKCRKELICLNTCGHYELIIAEDKSSVK